VHVKTFLLSFVSREISDADTDCPRCCMQSNSQLMGTRRAYLRDSPPTPATQSPLPPAAAAAQKVATLLLLQPHSQQENADQNELFCAEQLAPSPHATPQLSPQPSVQPGPGEPFRQLSINVGGGGGGCSPPKQLPPAHALGGPALLPNLTVMLPEARAAAAAELLKSSSSSETPPGWREYFRRQAELRDAADTAAAEGLPAATARRPATAAVRRAGALPARPPARGAGGVRDQGHQGSGTAKEFVITLGGGASATGGGGGGDACSFSRLKSPAPLRPALEPLLPLSSDKEAAGGAAWLKYSPPVAGALALDSYACRHCPATLGLLSSPTRFLPHRWFKLSIITAALEMLRNGCWVLEH